MDDVTVENDGVSIAIVAEFLAQEGWPYELSADQQMLIGGYKGDHGQWVCYAHCRPEAGQCLFYSVAPVRAPEVLRPAVAEYLMRANWGLIMGNFELDYADGEIRFKTSVQLNSAPLSAGILHPLIFGNLEVMDRYLPGLRAVVALQQTPVDAIRAVEDADIADDNIEDAGDE